jgi:hypothetical protein
LTTAASLWHLLLLPDPLHFSQTKIFLLLYQLLLKLLLLLQPHQFGRKHHG